MLIKQPFIYPPAAAKKKLRRGQKLSMASEGGDFRENFACRQTKAKISRKYYPSIDSFCSLRYNCRSLPGINAPRRLVGCLVWVPRSLCVRLLAFCVRAFSRLPRGRWFCVFGCSPLPGARPALGRRWFSAVFLGGSFGAPLCPGLVVGCVVRGGCFRRVRSSSGAAFLPSLPLRWVGRWGSVAPRALPRGSRAAGQARRGSLYSLSGS